MTRTIEEMETAAMAAADELSDWGKNRLRSDVEAAGLGPKVARSWRSIVYPERGTQSLGPSILWVTRATEIIQAFTEGAEIVPVRGAKYLALPTEHAPKAPRRRSSFGTFERSRDLRVEAATQRYGRLRYVFPRGKRFGLLVADGLMASRGKRGGFRPASDAARRTGRVVNGVVMFVLVPRAVLKKRLNTGAIEDQIQSEAVMRFTQAFYRILNTHFPQEGI